jgi:3-phosphoshikimate 1-carboxyvinyltransferase
MTKSLMNDFGIDCQFQDQKIIVPSHSYQPAKIIIEADWSAASYWFAFVALAKEATITLKNISLHSLQGDVIIIEIMEKLGVKYSFSNGELILSKQSCKTEIEWDFKDCPDLAQTVLPVCAAKGIRGVFKGLESLRIKETDRIAALQMELQKIGASITENNGEWVLIPNSCHVTSLQFTTYHDHRMAMGLAPLATKYEVQFDDSTVVNKSYPGFWLDCQSVGFQVLV